jgi:hypothetical protein
MATVGQPTSNAARRAQIMREYWSQVRGPTANALGAVAGFFIAYPPLAQGLYYLLRGLWPLLRTSSTYTTDTDIWLAQSGGVLTLVIGATLCLAAYRRVGSPEILLLAFGSALSLTALEMVFVFHGRISAIYMIDACIQVGLVAFWVYGWRKKEKALAQAKTQAQVQAQAQAPRMPPATVEPATIPQPVAPMPVAPQQPGATQS